MGFPSLAIRIKAIRFEGLTRTNPEFLKSLMTSKVGQHYLEDIWVADVQQIKNTNLFFDVIWTMKEEEEQLVLTVTCQEAFSIFPILDFSAINGNFKLLIGANQKNWLGKNYTLGGFYQWYDRHGLKLYNVAPRHLNGITGHEIYLTKYSTIEPLYFGEGKSDFNFDNYSVSSAVYLWVDNFHRFTIGGQLMYEHYENIEKEIADFHVGKTLDLYKYQIRAAYEWKAINLHHEFFDGHYAKLYWEIIKTQGFSDANFNKVQAQFNYYKRIGKKGNFATRIGAGIATNNLSPFSPFVLDSYLNIRGIGNRVVRGTAELIANVEYRQTIWTHPWFYLQSNVFADLGTIRLPGAALKELIKGMEGYYYTGLGLRIHTRKIYNSVLRFDYGFNAGDFRQGGFVFGIQQFF